jgi:hypothetical protein
MGLNARRGNTPPGGRIGNFNLAHWLVRLCQGDMPQGGQIGNRALTTRF